MKCTQRLYLTADRKKVVHEGHKHAASLYAVPGDEIPQSAHDAFNLVDGHLKGFDPDATPAPKEPEQPPAPTTVIATQTLYHSSESSDSLVAEDDPAADELYAKVGDAIPVNAHERFGLVDGHLPDFDPEAAKLKAEEEAKAKEAAEAAEKAGLATAEKEDKGVADKEQKGGADKGGAKPGDNKDSGADQVAKSGEQV